MENPTFQLADGCASLSLYPNFILPDDKRPHLSEVSPLTSVPVIDMNENVQPHSSLVKKISQACEEYGFFQIINHAVPNALCQSMMDVVNQFFHLPPEERARLFTEDKTKPSGGVCHSYYAVDGKEKVTLWSETLTHPLYPSDDFADLLPKNPPRYREIATEYFKEISGLVCRVLSLISQGLGLEQNCLRERIGFEDRSFRLHAHYYPPCPDPELTLGLLSHTDLNALTILRQSEGVTGLQVLKDGKWLAVEPVPNAFVVNLGDQIQVLSNGKYKSSQHRAVTNNHMYRTSLAMFYGPNKDTLIGPIEDLITADKPPLYRNYFFREFIAEFCKQDGTEYKVKEAFEIQH